nr:RNA-directed DNA polymerase, eukaryota [Tanacetum cinerariifolium]
MGTWAPTSSKLLIISVYAPQELNERRDLWDYLRTFIDRWEGDTVIMGDFNEVRSEHERFGSTFNRQWTAFNNFISSACLIDLPLEGYAFTWAHKSDSKMSKLDRYLISEGVLDLFPRLSALCLDRHLSDHRPILLRETSYDYGLSPFQFFHSWFAMEGLNYFVETTWKSLNIVEPNGLVRLKKKLQALKIAIKALSKEANKRNAIKISQKAKIRWSIEDQVQDLERTITYEEVKRAVWDCGTNKSPGQMDFPLNFTVNIGQQLMMTLSSYKSYWERLQNHSKKFGQQIMYSSALSHNDVQSDFVANHQILDGHFILNELLSWCKFKKLNGMIFKVDFEKAFDSVKWEYLDETLKAFGFGSKWHNWISSCLNNAMGSVLVNGSPTLEFQFHKGLKQGDPISPFLFILIMGTLHLTFKRVLNADLYKGIPLYDSCTISLLFYADDVVFIGKWKNNNIQTLLSVLRYFYLASGLKTNFHKSKLMGIGVSSNVVAPAASLIGCFILTAIFNYLGVK